MFEKIGFRFTTLRSGMAKALGSLEAEIMELIWAERKPITVAEVHERLTRRRPVAYTTVMTVMTRLADKGLLNRMRSGIAYVYTPAMTKQEFISSMVKSVIDGLLEDFSEPAMAYFVARLGEADEARLAQLEEIIKQRRKQEQE